MILNATKLYAPRKRRSGLYPHLTRIPASSSGIQSGADWPYEHIGHCPVRPVDKIDPVRPCIQVPKSPKIKFRAGPGFLKKINSLVRLAGLSIYLLKGDGRGCMSH